MTANEPCHKGWVSRVDRLSARHGDTPSCTQIIHREVPKRTRIYMADVERISDTKGEQEAA